MWSGAAAALVALAVAVQAPAEPVAIVLETSSSVRVVRGKQAGLMARAGLRLVAGDSLVIPRGARAVLLYRSGRMESLSGSIAVRAGEGPGVLSSTLAALDKSAATAAPSPNRPGAPRPLATAPVPVLPIHEITVLSAQPTFVWFSAGPGDYTLQLRPLDSDRFQRFEARDTVWQYPADQAPLTRGARYEWTVFSANGRSDRSASFRVLDLKGYQDYQARLSGIDGLTLPARLVLEVIVTYELGLFYETQRGLEALARLGVPLGEELAAVRSAVARAMGTTALGTGN